MNLAVADEHPLTREGIRVIVESNGIARVIAEAGSAMEVLALVRKRSIDAVILDFHMTHPLLDGVTILEYIAQIRPTLPVIALISDNIPLSTLMALEAGAKRVICKTAAAPIWVATLRSLQHASGGRDSLHTASLRRSLTEQEQRVLELLSEGLSVSEVAVRMKRSIGTVSKHKRNVMRKFDLGGNREMHEFLKSWSGE